MKFNSFITTKVHSGGLGITRLLFALVLLLEVCQIFYYRDFIYTANPFESASTGTTVGLILWIICLFFLSLGYCTQMMAFFSFIACSYFLVPYPIYEYHVDYIYQGISLIFVFCPTHRSLSLDKYISKCSSRVEIGWYFLLILAGIALVYFDSVFHKLASPMWKGGLGIWQPGSHIASTWFSPEISSIILNNKPFMLVSGYLVFVFEVLFIFLMWNRRFTLPLFLIGVFLHFGILVMFPIPLFGLAVLALYPLVAPFSSTQKISEHAESLLFALFDQFKWIKRCTTLPVVALRLTATQCSTAFLVTYIGICVFQGFIIMAHSPIGKKLSRRMHINLVPLTDTLPFRTLSAYTGLTTHPVFMDGHFRGYNHTLSVEAADASHGPILLPMTKESGQPGYSGRLWVHWCFQTVHARVDEARLRKRLERHAAFWMKKYDLDPESTILTLSVKTTEVPFKWQKNLLSNATKNPWQKIGTGSWKDEKLILETVPVESVQYSQSTQ